MSHLVIRPIQSGDSDRIAALHAASFDRPWPAPEMARLLGTSTIAGWMACAGAEPSDLADAGFLLGQFVGEEAEILTIAVDPAARRRGIGLALVAALLEHAGRTGVRSLFLEVAADNAAARRLYAASGFVPVGLRKAYYPGADGPIDAHLLRRILT